MSWEGKEWRITFRVKGPFSPHDVGVATTEETDVELGTREDSVVDDGDSIDPVIVELDMAEVSLADGDDDGDDDDDGRDSAAAELELDEVSSLGVFETVEDSWITCTTGLSTGADDTKDWAADGDVEVEDASTTCTVLVMSVDDDGTEVGFWTTIGKSGTFDDVGLMVLDNFKEWPKFI
jgi:hypothetical protein